VISQQGVHPDKRAVQEGRFLDHPSNGIVNYSQGFVKGTDSHADRTTHSVLRPETEALFGVRRPFHHSLDVGDAVHPVAGWTVWQRLGWAAFRTAVALLAEFLHTEAARLIRD